MTLDELKNHVTDHLAGRVTCREFTEAVTEYLEGSQGFLRWVRFQMHLGLCPGCRTYLRQMKQTIHTLGRLPEQPVPPAVRDELLRRFRARQSREPR